MITFIRKISVFVVISIVLLSIITVAPIFFIRQNALFEIKDSAKIIVLGHSHAECAYNDEIIPDLENLGASGESYFYTFQKVKKIFTQNQDIETVLLEFTNNQIDEVMDEWTWGYDKMSFYLPKYLPFLDCQEIEVLNTNNPSIFRSTFSVASRKNLFRLIKADYDFTDEIGGFRPLDISAVDKILDTLTIEGHEYEKTFKTSKINLLYLRKIIDYCRNEGKEVFLIRTPQHKSYPMLKNENLFQSVRKSQFADVYFIDFNNNDLPNNYYADLEHLNGKGAKVVSEKLEQLIKEGLITSKEKFFINKTFTYFITDNHSFK